MDGVFHIRLSRSWALEARPGWRLELRRLLFADDILELPGIVRELAEAQRRSELRIEQLATAQDRTESVVRGLAETTHRLGTKVSEMSGYLLEQRYRDRAPAYFSRLLRRVRLISQQDLAHLLEDAEERSVLTEEERISLLACDVVVRGVTPEDRQETYLAAAVSVTVDTQDVERAAERAGILSRITGKPALAVVAGKTISDLAAARARERHVQQVLDGVSA